MQEIFKGENFENKEKNKQVLDFILERSNELGPEMIENYKDFHENPELGGEEFETAKKVVNYLKSLGIEIVGEGIGSSGAKGRGASIVAKIKGSEGGPTIALRADMDALPMVESENNEPRSKKVGVMHGCGHDAHTAGLMGGAKILKELADKGELEGNALLLFQSSEEKARQKESGAVQVIKFLEKNGLRKDIDAFLGLHVFTELERGKVQLKDGVQSGSSGEVDIILRAPGGHIKDVYKDPSLHRIFYKITLKLEERFKPLYEEALVASARTEYDIEEKRKIMENMRKGVEEDVKEMKKGKIDDIDVAKIDWEKIKAGYNVLPADGESTFVVRVTSPDYKEISGKIAQEIDKVVREAVSEEEGAEKVGIEIKRRAGYRPVIHRNPGVVKVAEESSREVLKNYKQIEEVMQGGEDFSFYLEKFRGKEIPGVFAMVGGANPEKGYLKCPHHNPNFKIDPDAIKDLAALYSNFTVKAIDYFKNKK
jgi:amidohydrolase